MTKKNLNFLQLRSWNQQPVLTFFLLDSAINKIAGNQFSVMKIQSIVFHMWKNDNVQTNIQPLPIAPKITIRL